jgi:oligoendopeptidase F
MTATKTTGAEQVFWNLDDLYPGVDSPAFQHDLTTIVDTCTAFRDRWKGRIASVSNEDFRAMLNEYEGIVERLYRMGSYTQLMWSTDTVRADYGKNLQTVRETGAKASQQLVFVSLEIMDLTDGRLQELMQWPGMADRAHWLQTVVQMKPYKLSEEVEQVLAQKNLTARMAWVRLYDEHLSSQVFHLNGEDLTQPQIMKKMQSTDREVRKAASQAISVGLQAGVRTSAFVFNTVLADHSTNDSLRGHTSWIQTRNLDNEASEATVQALIDSVVSQYELVRRFYRLKQRVLGYDTFEDYDRNAPVEATESFWTWDDARELVLSAYREFHPEAGNIVQQFFDKNWIHAPVMKGKNGGAYSAGTVPSVHPYIFLNYTGTNRDVQTLAHELGHGVHQYLSRRNGPLEMHTPLTVAETASVFGEILTFTKLMERVSNPEERLSLLMGKIDDMLSTVFRQIASVDRLNEIWLETQKAQFGDAVNIQEGYRVWWSYISHFMHVPGYVYAYAFGELLVLALYEIYKQDPVSFPDKYMDMLSAGGSKTPAELLAPFGINIEDPAFWSTGLKVIESFIAEAEQLAETVTIAPSRPA